MRLCSWIVAGCLCLFPLALEQTAWAQNAKPDTTKNKNDAKPGAKKDMAGAKPADAFQAAGGPMEIAKAEGKLEAMQQGIIKIGTADKKEVFLKSNELTQVNYTAEADLAWLSPGVFVRFSASFDANGTPTEPLKSIEVFTPVMNRNLAPEQIREQTPGVYQEGKDPPAGAKNLFNNGNKKAAAQRDKKETAKDDKDANKKDAAAKKDSKKKTAVAAGPGQAYRVIGRVTGVQDNTIMVIAGQPMQLELAPDCKIAVNATELSTVLNLAIKGDDVTVSGLRNPAQPTIVMAEQITIKAAKKLTQPEVPNPKQARSSRTNAKGKDKDKDKDDDKDKTRKTADKKKPGNP